MRDLSDMGIKWPVQVQLDGVDEGLSLRRAGYARFAVTPGQHVINAHLNHLLTATPDITVSSVFEAGKACYFAIGTDTHLAFPGIEYDSLMHLVEPRLVRIVHDRTSSAAVKRDHGQRHAKRS